MQITDCKQSCSVVWSLWSCLAAQGVHQGGHVHAGEYNLRLGILKELHPEIIATHQGGDK